MDMQQIAVSFFPESHTYYADGKLVPSVTNLINTFAKQHDRFVSDERYEECAEEGRANHAAVEDMLSTGKSSCGYTDAVQRFIEEQESLLGELVMYETPLGSKRGFAGTPDMVFEHAIVDLKRSFGDKKIHALQLAGYHALVVENGIITPTKQQYILVADEDGTYSFTQVYHPLAEQTFLSLVARHKIEMSLAHYLFNAI